MFDWDIDGQIDHSITAKLKATQKRFNQSGYCTDILNKTANMSLSLSGFFFADVAWPYEGK
jgi:hypothetical protein